MQLLITDGATFFHEERRHLRSTVEYLQRDTLGYRICSEDPEGRYRLQKEILCDPHQPCVLLRARLQPAPEWKDKLRVYVLLAPHLEVGGWGNSACVASAAGQRILLAWKKQTWLALGVEGSFARASCGYVGVSDGWQDLHDNLQMDWEFAAALEGNIAVLGQVDPAALPEFTVALAFGPSRHAAITTLMQSLAIPFAQHREKYIEQWNRVCCDVVPLDEHAGDGGRLFRISHSLLLAHEDKTYAGALIASASIPWGEAKGDEDIGGYHLVWTRDLVNSATGLLACGDQITPQRALVYLACSQRADGGFPQNFWLDGTPYWSAIQLDEVAFPVMLAWRLWKADALGAIDPYPMVVSAARFLILNGPATEQERWEENAGYSPSTLAANIAALVCAADFARARSDEVLARFLEDYADFLESHLERWTVTTDGTLVAGIPRHYIRIHPVNPGDPYAEEDPNRGWIQIRNRPPAEPAWFPAKDIVDAGFLELVRYGIRRPGDPLIEDSLRVVDAVLKVDTPAGPCWHRYNHDGYGSTADGGPFLGWGVGRAWPLLTGERGHYELAAGRDARLYLNALEQLASSGGLLPEQVWDEPGHPRLGRPAGSAMPLMWAHAEYIKLLRSITDGQVFDCIPVVAERYLKRRGRKDLEVWKPNRRPRRVAAGQTLRVQAPKAFRLHWTLNGWSTIHDTMAADTALGIYFVDVPVPRSQTAPVQFTLFWTDEDRWHGEDFTVAVEAAEKGA